jgi:hypothetical protein
MNTSFTPGPWFIDPKYPKVVQSKSNDENDMRDPVICEMYNSDFVTPEHQEANAKLIAAAPELLEVLNEYANGEPLNEVKWYEKVKQAIAKAEGRA